MAVLILVLAVMTILQAATQHNCWYWWWCLSPVTLLSVRRGFRRTVLESSGKPEEGVARKPEKKKKKIQTNKQELTVGLGKGKIKGRKSPISGKNVLEFYDRCWEWREGEAKAGDKAEKDGMIVWYQARLFPNVFYECKVQEKRRRTIRHFNV